MSHSGATATLATRVAVVGQGYAGLPLAMRAVDAGFDVVGLDVDTTKVKRLGSGESYVEDVPSGRLTGALQTGRYRPTDDPADLAGFDVCVITVPTPLRDGVPNLSFIDSAGRSVAAHLRAGATVVLESTTYPGTTEELLCGLLEEGSGLCASTDFFLGYSPERIDPGNPVWRLENTPKVVAGVDPTSLERVAEFYGQLVERVVPVSSPRVAELTKLLENTFRHVNIALVNEVAVFARQLGIDVWEAIDAAATKPFGYLPFRPGPGVGGHCLPIDPSYLSWQVKRTLGHHLRFVELANDINDRMPHHVVQRVAAGLNERRKPVNGSRILLLGLAYKKNNGDIRESPALSVIRGLRALGADIRAVEPHITPDLSPPGVTLVELTTAEVGEADAVVLLTDHDLFDYRMMESTASYVFDARNRCTGPQVERL
jgi:UDP-N-acetyl-D-glucosamine dehydrogenase